MEHYINTFNQVSTPLTFPDGHISDRASPKTAINNKSINYTCTFTALTRYLLQDCIMHTIFLWFFLLIFIIRITAYQNNFQIVKKDTENNLTLITSWRWSQTKHYDKVEYGNQTKFSNLLYIIEQTVTCQTVEYVCESVCVCVLLEGHTSSLQSTSFTQVIMWTSS